MGRKYGGTTTTGGRKYSTSSDALTQAKALGYQEKEISPTLLDRLFGLLSAGETGSAAYALATGQDPLKQYATDVAKGVTLQGMGGKKTYSDVLAYYGMPEGLPRTGLGLGLDILLDPTTYAGGLIFKPIRKGGKLAVKGAKKIPAVKSGIEALENLFVTGAKAKRLGKAGEEYWSSYLKYAKGTRGEQTKLIGELGQAFKGLDELGVTGETLLKAEKGIQAVPKAQREYVQPIIDLLSEWGGEEAKRGILKSQIDNYIPHILSKEGREFVTQGKLDLIGLSKPLRVKLGAGKERKLLGTIKEINKYTLEKHGIKLFEESPFKIMAQRGVSSVRAVNTRDFLVQTGKRFGIENTEDVTSKVLKGINYVKSQAPDLEKVLLPEPIAKHLDDTYKFLTNDEQINGLLMSYDKVLNFWKGTVTGYFPAFHSRNAVGGVYNNFLAGLKNPLRYAEANDIALGKAGKLVLDGKDYTYKELGNLMTKSGVFGQTGIIDVVERPEEIIQGVKGIKKLKDLPRGIMGFIEDRLRGALFLDRLDKGDDAWSAAKEVIKYHFDYMPEGLTTFERQVMKRLVPFYTWLRGNIPLQITQAFQQPGKVGAVGKTLRALRGDTEQLAKEYETLPEYMKAGFPIRLGETQKGQPEYIYGLGLPLEDINRLRGKTALDVMSPLIKFPLERLTGKQFYLGKDISELSTAPQIVGKFPKPIKKFLDYEETTRKGKTYRTLNPYKWHFITSAISRGLFTADRLTDPKFAVTLKALYAGMGLKVKQVDLEKEKYYRQREEEERINQYLEARGKRKKFETYYEPSR